MKDATLVGFVATANATEAKRFYSTALGLQLVEDTPFAIVFETGGNLLRIQKLKSVTPAGHTVLGWNVKSIAAAVAEMTKNGVKFARFEGLSQDPSGVWTTPDGSKVAWFHDPDGNILSISELAPR